MPQKNYTLHLKGFVGGADFDRNSVELETFLTALQEPHSGGFCFETKPKFYVKSHELFGHVAIILYFCNS